MEKFIEQGHLTDQAIALYVDALKLNKVEKVPASVQKHIDSCIECHHQVTDLYSMLGDISYSEKGSHPSLEKVEKTDGKIFSMVMRLAVAALIAGLVFSFYQTYKEEKRGINPIVIDTTTIKKEAIEEQYVGEEKKETPIPEIPQEEKLKEKQEVPKSKLPPVNFQEEQIDVMELYAANFTPNEEQEGFVDGVLRSDEFELSEPQNTATFKKDEIIHFKWTTNNTDRKELYILNNKEEVQHKIILVANTYEMLNTLEPGLYYWKLETEEDLLHVGKFLVK